MNLRRAMFAACMVSMCAGAANAQLQPVQPAPPQQEPPCIQEFFKLRDEAEKKATAIKAANDRKAPPKEACQLFGTFIAAQQKLLKYASDNTVWCGIPKQVVEGLKQGIVKVSEIRTKVCQAAASPAAQPPSLSDALANPVPDSNNIKTGRGTFDTLTGSPIGK
ncbi:MAG: hypothetical protein WA905_19035 [Pseudolabrys sp.]